MTSAHSLSEALLYSVLTLHFYISSAEGLLLIKHLKLNMCEHSYSRGPLWFKDYASAFRSILVNTAWLFQH